MSLDRAFFDRDAGRVAPDLIGCGLCVDAVGGLIVETEAYEASDPAAHSFGGRTLRNASMFEGPGRAYVYRSYGLHWCLNFVCARAGGVLIRALEPTQGLAIMAARRGLADPRLLCAGPGRLAQALGVTRAQDGAALDAPPFALQARAETIAVASGPRIGISKGVDTPWRFARAGSPFLSKPMRQSTFQG